MTHNDSALKNDPKPIAVSTPETEPNNTASVTGPAVYTPPLIKPKKTIPFEKRDLTFAGIIFIASVFLIDAALWNNFAAGYALLEFLIISVSLFYLSSKDNKKSAFAGFCIVGAFAMVPIFVIYSDPFSKFWVFCAVNILIAIALTEKFGAPLHSSGSFRFISDFLKTSVARPFSKSSLMLRSMVRKSEDGKNREFLWLLTGVLCAVPALVIIIPLLISSDAAFEGLVNSFSFDFGRILCCLFLGIILFILLFSLLFSLRKEREPEKTERPEKTSGILPSTLIAAFQSTISLIYVVYLFSQLAYFWGALSGILPQGYNHSEYARRGFFEMCAVCALNLLIGFFCLLLVRRKDNKIPLSVRTLFLFLCGFSLVLISCSFGKMVLYVQELGMTRLRICTSVFMIMLFFVFIFAIIRVFKPSFPYMRAAVIVVTILGLITAWADIDTVTARYNTEAYLNGNLQTVDVYTISDLSDAAVPYLLEIAEKGGDQESVDAKVALADRYSHFYMYNRADGNFTERESFSLSAYNITENRAKQLLSDNIDVFRAAIDTKNNSY